MSPNIRIDEEVYNCLQKQARAFVDTPNSVLRRLLQLDPSAEETHKAAKAKAPPRGIATAPRSRRGSSKAHARRGREEAPRAQTGTILPAEEYDIPLLSVIAEHGGAAPARDVITELGKKLGGRLTPLDRERLASGGVRWENRAQFVRLRLVDQGLLAKDSPRGTWSLTDLGRARLAQNQ